MNTIINKRCIGLDPIFRSCVKIKIKDFKELKLVESQDSELSELYCFMNHVINKVEVMGIVVMTDRWTRFNSFAVDDGTGVVLCVCWKSTKNAPKTESSVGDLPTSLEHKYRELQAYNKLRYEDECSIGHLVQVRGWISTYRDRRELFVLDHRKIDNPCVEMEAVLEYPSLYKIYKQSFVPPSSLTEQMDNKALKTLTVQTVQDAISRYIQDSSCSQVTVTLQDILLWPAIVAITSSCKENDMKNKEAHLNIIKLALQNLESTKGSIYQLSLASETYEIIRADCPMAMTVMVILRNACQTDRNAENGCHILHLKTRLTTYPEYSRVPDPVMFYLLSCLEANSDVVSVNPQRYIHIS